MHYLLFYDFAESRIQSAHEGGNCFEIGAVNVSLHLSAAKRVLNLVEHSP
jgi:hypothetical protein